MRKSKIAKLFLLPLLMIGVMTAIPILTPIGQPIVHAADQPCQPDSADPNKCSGKTYNSVANDCRNKTDLECTGIVQHVINPIIIFLTIGVGLIITIMLIIGGVQYITAGGDASAVGAAKSKIFNAIFALIAYALLFAVFQWLIPGGFGV